MKLERVLTMGLGELAERSRQELSKTLDRVGGRRNGDLYRRVFADLDDGPILAPIRERARAGDARAACEMLFAAFRVAFPARFFEGAQSAEVSSFLPPGASDRVIARAEALCHGRFDLLGYSGLFFGDPVDWHLDPVSGRRAPRVHWSLIDPLDAARIGDHKVIWELNRHQWFVCLGQAYRVTGDERFAVAFTRYVLDWMRANPPGLGINWASSLEVALRLIAWCWALALFRTSPRLPPTLFVRMLGHIWAAASHVERYLSGYFSPNTHLTGEALGLFYAGTVFPELRAARRWRALGQRILETESEVQILPDGVHFELATCYHRYTLEIYLHFLILAARNRIVVRAGLAERVERMLDFLLAVQRPDGSMPEIGDADGGCLLPLAGRGPGDPRGLFATAAAFFGRADCAWAARTEAPEAAWQLGPPGVRALEALAPAPPALPVSHLFGDAGYVVMRSGYGDKDHQLIFDVGPLGCPVSAGHGHADLLSIQCSLWGTPYLVDPGTYSYRSDLVWRDVFRSTASHSTVMVDGLGQAEPAGPFGWRARPEARLLGWSSTPTLDLADARHEAYARLADPVRHRRRVLWMKPRYWVLVDDLEGGAPHRIDLRFQFAPITVLLEPSSWARARDARGHGLLVRAFASVPLEAEIREGDLHPIEGWVSHDYGQRSAAPVLVYSAVTRLPLRVVTLLWPVEDGWAAPPAVSAVTGEGGAPVGLAVGDEGETIVFGDEGA